MEDLLFSYNIVVDQSDEMEKILNKSAAYSYEAHGPLFSYETIL